MQISFILDGLSRGRFTRRDVAPILAFAAKTAPGIVRDAMRLADAIKRLDPATDLKSSPLAATRIAAGLPTAASAATAAMREARLVIEALTRLGIDTAPAAQTMEVAASSRPGSGGRGDDRKVGQQARPGSIALLVARGTGVDRAITKGLALKLGVAARRRKIDRIAPAPDIAAAVPVDDDAFYGTCISDDACMLRTTEALGYPAVLLIYLERRPDGSLRARLVYSDVSNAALTRRAADVPEAPDRILATEVASLLVEGR